MRKEKIEDIDKIVKALEDLSFVVKDFTKLKIVMLLYLNELDGETSLSFAEIKDYLGKKYSSALVSYHIRQLEKRGIIENERKLDISTGKARSSFYKLTRKGKWIGNILTKIKTLYIQRTGNSPI